MKEYFKIKWKEMCRMENANDSESEDDLRNVKFFRSFIYASNSGRERKELWALLQVHKNIASQRTWILMRDFNVTLKTIEHSAGGSYCVRKEWETKIKGCYMYKVVKKLKRLKKPVNIINLQNGNLTDKANAASILNEYVVAFNEELKLFHHKAKIKWLCEGDQNTAYFHGILKSRKHKGRIESICDENGKRFEEDNVASVFVEHFKKFLETKHDVQPLESIDVIFDNVLSKKEAEDMIGIVTNEEIKEAVFEIDSNKASGEINATLIALVPKVDVPKKVSEFRHIACCNVIYKALVKSSQTDSKFFVCVNGEAHGYFNGGRGLIQGDIVSSYLFTLMIEGVPLIAKKLGINDCKSLVEKVAKKINCLKNKVLTYQLIASVLSPMQIYWASVYMLPCTTIKEIEKFSIPKDQGGLGIKSVKNWNEMLLIKQLWKIIEGLRGLFLITWSLLGNVVKIERYVACNGESERHTYPEGSPCQPQIDASMGQNLTDSHLEGNPSRRDLNLRHLACGNNHSKDTLGGQLLMIVHTSKQAIFCIVESLQRNVKFFRSFIYASNSGRERQEFWALLQVHKNIASQRPWILMRDFNVTLKTSEHSAGGSCMNGYMIDYNECVNSLELEDIWCFGFQFIWTKSLKNPNFSIMRKLHRIMINEEFLQQFKNARGMFLPFVISDHSPDVANAASILNEFVVASNEELKLFHHKAKIKRLSEGDQNTSYFHGILKSRKHKGRIESICDENDVIFDNVLSKKEAKDMIGIVTNEEIKEVVFDIDSNKASVLDGYTSGFFKKHRVLLAMRFFVCVNGEAHGYFNGGRGLIQGDPVSSYLFTLMMEGVPLIAKKLGINDCKSLVDKVAKKINCWKNKVLTYAGRIKLIASVLSSMQIYWASVYMLPCTIIKEIEKFCMPKDQGGLGIKSVKNWNEVLLIKQLWKIIEGNISIPNLSDGAKDKVYWLDNQKKMKDFPTKQVWIDLRENTDKVEWHHVEKDSHAHLFFKCEFAEQIWKKLMDKMRNVRSNNVLKNIVNSLALYKAKSKLVLAVAVYYIWQERN
nr:hypothetical protein [Tanacetum cinerariifolium]